MPNLELYRCGPKLGALSTDTRGPNSGFISVKQVHVSTSSHKCEEIVAGVSKRTDISAICLTLRAC